MTTTLSTLLLFDGAIHLLLAPTHGVESPLLGASFLLCGLLQCVLGGFVVRHNSLGALALIGVVSVAALASYILAVTVGLPMLPDEAPMAMSHLQAGMPMAGMSMPEEMTPLGLISKLAEVATLVAAGCAWSAWGTGRSSQYSRIR